MNPINNSQNQYYSMNHQLLWKNRSPCKVVQRCYSFWWKDTETAAPNFSLVAPQERLPKVDINLFPETIRKPNYALNGDHRFVISCSLGTINLLSPQGGWEWRLYPFFQFSKFLYLLAFATHETCYDKSVNFWTTRPSCRRLWQSDSANTHLGFRGNKLHSKSL